MNKCPNCGGMNDSLSRVCSFCSIELPQKVSGIAESTCTPSPKTDSIALCEQIQKDLASLAAQSPNSNLLSFITGFFSIPTLGLAYLAIRAITVLGNEREGEALLLRRLDENLRVAETSYRSDPEIRKLLDRAGTEIAIHKNRSQKASRSMISGMILACILSLVATGLLLNHWKQVADSKAAELAESVREKIEAQRLEDLAKAKAISEQVTKDRIEYLTRYVPEAIPDPNTINGRIAVLVADVHTRDLNTTDKFTKILRSCGQKVTTNLLSERAVVDGLVGRLMANDSSVIRDLELAKHADWLLVVHKSQDISKNREMADILTAKLCLKVAFINLSNGATYDSYEISTNGAGITREDAINLAMDRAFEQAQPRLNEYFKEFKTESKK